MQNIESILKEFGLEIPADKQADFSKKVAENYITKAEHEKKLGKLEADRDGWKEKAETAEATLKSFEGIDPEKIQSELKEWRQKAEAAEADFKQQLADRDLNDKLKEKFSKVKVREDMVDVIIGELKGLVSLNKNGDLIGFEQGIDSLQKKRPSAFIDEKQEALEANRVRFTTTAKPGNGARLSGKKLSEMTLDERIKLKQSDPEYYESLRKGD